MKVSAANAVEALVFLISQMKVLRKLEINMDDGDATYLNKLLKAVLDAGMLSSPFCF